MSKFLEKKKIYFNNEICSRKKKLNKLRKLGFNFPNNFRKNAISEHLHNLYKKKTKHELKKLNIEVSIAGRIITKRIIGKATFINLQDVGGQIQLYISYNKFTNKFYNNFLKNFDIGDIIGTIGKLFKTNTGELTLYCNKIILLTKSIRPLPDKFHGLSSSEIRYRKRYLDLISNSKSRNIFKIRSRIITEIRNFMISNDFMEVETPMMQTIPGGASARPFVTHHNALNIKMYLRIAPELYLKRLIIGGFEKIFEINRNFRNEGLSSVHNPEFTMMELYMAYANYYDLIDFVEKLFFTITKIVLGTCIVNYGKYTFDFSKPFNKMTMTEAILTYNKNLSKKDIDKISYANKIAKLFDINVKKKWGIGRIQSEIFKKTTEHHLIQPTFITSYPLEISPLARINNKNPMFTERLELFIGGHEIGNGFSELNDSEEQKIRFYNQIKKNKSNNKYIFNDKDYIIALEYGLPPTAGLGIGIDRIIMFLTNSDSIKDVILFPTLRPKT